jgi:hypothetical protein
MLGNYDIQQRSKGRMLTWAKMVYEDMNLSTLKIAQRSIFKINKRTNSINMPCDSSQISSVNIMFKGVTYPVFRNDKLHDDIVDSAAANDCGCEKKCNYNLCNLIKGYEAIVSTKSDFLPNGNPISFTCVDRKSVDSQGFFTEETQYPQRIYISGVWTDTVLHTETKKLCKLDIDEQGCVCDTEENLDKCCESCGINELIPHGGTANISPDNNTKDTWIYYCDSKKDWFSTQCGFPRHKCDFNNIYNISELGDRLIFPADFGFDEVMIRWFSNPNLKDMEVPLIAVDTFIAGLKWFDVKYNDKAQALEPKYATTYARMKFGLLRELNKYRIAELKMILTPPIHVDGTIVSRRGYYGDH